jgi:hypothetical protein
MPRRSKSLLVLCVFVTVTLSSSAQQSAPKLEVFAGYAYARNFQDGLITVIGPSGILQVNGIALHGWSGSVTANAADSLGITADFGGYYQNVGLNFSQIGGNGGAEVAIRGYSFMFGPQFSSRKQESFTPFGRVLIGGVYGKTGSSSETVFAFGAGGGVDATVYQNVAVRVAADWVRTHFGEEGQNNLRLTTGLVFRFGGTPKRARAESEPGTVSKQVVGISLLGVTGYETAQGFQLVSVSANSPAENAGLRVQDVIVAINDTPVHSLNDVAAAMSGKAEVRVSYLRRYWQTVTTVIIAQ